MGFERGVRRGRIWDDANLLHKQIMRFPFATTGNTENAFERGFATTLMATEEQYNEEVVTQIKKGVSVQSVYAFGKKHRPDMTLGENGIAVEMKFIRYGGLKDAIGQGYLYRLKYKFVFLVLILSESRKEVYDSIENGEEKDLDDVLHQLAEDLNIFTYLVPAFQIKKPGMRKAISYFEPRL
ncbi:hypothetical protein [Wenzhouxiangella sediminis]|uniref:Uncharacterized protein n=1 Tax=Wenzhouxiangella sediminis TaxID=1792836 RepID=A0A3E1K671_9GAMM|nr:hypothetical protein [Wenzhouxiangella sediminis]RFF29164.1 hypothetical protein DZC52_15040 [Wenzhouxiangella sediminis]